MKETYKLPEGWRWIKLGNIVDIFYGKGLPKDKRRDKGKFYAYGSNGPIYRTDQYLVDPPVLVIGRKGSIGAIHLVNEKCWPIDTTYYLKIKGENIDIHFLFWYLKTVNFSKIAITTTKPGLNREDLKILQIPLPFKNNTPDLDKQKRIVAKIEELFKKIDKIKELKNQALNQVKNLLTSALHKIFSKADEKGWKWIKLGSICLVRGGKRLPKGDKFSAVPTPFRYIRVSDFEDMSVNVNTVQYITKDVRNKIKDYIITKEDVYLSIAGTIGKAGTVPEELDKSNLTENAARLIIKNKGTLDKTYLAFCLNSPYVQKIIENFTKIVGQPKLALFRIKEIQIPLAPLDEQKRIVSYLDQISEKQKILLKIYENIDNQLTELKQSILNKTFRGEL